jgi:hypothetical protein
VRGLSRRARRLLALALSLAVAAAAAGLAISLRGNGQAQAAAGPAPGRPAAAPGPQPGSTQARADLSRMQALLNSGSVSAQAAVLPPGSQFTPGSGPVFPAGTTIQVRQKTFRSESSADGQFGTAGASLSSGKTVTLGLVAEQGHWYLYHVTPGTAQASAEVYGRVAPAGAQLDSATANPIPTKAQIGTRTPVILIHGINGHGTDFGSDYDAGSMFASVDSIQGTWTASYDYTATNRQWVNVNGPLFASYIRHVAQVSKAAGGPGKVIIVAYSLGGLITRDAAVRGDSQGAAGQYISMVITIGTPNTGSFWANYFATEHAIACRAAHATGADKLGPVSRWCSDWSALAGMSAFGSQIDGLPELPYPIPLNTIAGDETYVIPYYQDGSHDVSIQIPLHGDGVVLLSSALHDRGGGHRTFYTVTNHLQPFDVSAWHGDLPFNPDVVARVHNLVAAWIRNHPMQAPAPALGGDAYWLAGGGQWFVHDYQLQITQGPSGLTGTEHWNAGPCDWQNVSDTAAGQCWGSDKLAFTSRPDGSLAGTVTSVPVYSSSAGSLPAGYQPEPGEPYRGQAIKLVPVAPMLAKFIQVSNDKFGNGNSNLCQQGLPSATETQYCGA